LFADLATILASRSALLRDCIACERYFVLASPSSNTFFGKRYIEKNGVKVLIPLSSPVGIRFQGEGFATRDLSLAVGHAYIVSDRVKVQYDSRESPSASFLAIVFLDVDLEHFLTEADKAGEFPL
jgi:hypothetical protein